MGAELLELRAHFGVSALEALTQMPAWEYDLLVASVRQAQSEEPDDDDEPDDEDGLDLPVPEALRALDA
jgi:hypothetical protein